ncbi:MULTISPECIES: hypothetical protein [Deinococcus]|uniref:Uncharacterized protein n=1 Tax=Deinococcus rufus TaxID=2136097 RepID=A0ABV7ZAU4_9DEIO|nr:hypothetical protein [Deinococcus sp. AB2017081]WQE97469.1 hypothetical protein U2P90_19900 [Deinococcus sp. AB2017081]WQE97493.1 hypothetical protein U2P90_20020 [Deinococcus sp. AB2017081]
MPTLTDIEERQRAVLDLLLDERDLRRLLESRQTRLTELLPGDPVRSELEASTSALSTLLREQQQAITSALVCLEEDSIAVASARATNTSRLCQAIVHDRIDQTASRVQKLLLPVLLALLAIRIERWMGSVRSTA